MSADGHDGEDGGVGAGRGGGDEGEPGVSVAAASLAASVVIDAPPERVFALWADAAGWPRWDPDLEAASLDGPFASGTTGVLKPRGAPRTRIVLREVEPTRAFTAVSRLPLCRMVFEHRLEPVAEGCRATHAVRFDGALAPLFRRLIGGTIRRGLPGTMAGLRRAAERGHPKPG